MSLFTYLLDLNLILGTLNALLFAEIIFQVFGGNNSDAFIPFERSQHITPIEHVQKRIIGGERADIKLSPYVTAVLVKDEIEGDYDLICASVIVSEYYSLTAAHCIQILEGYEASNRKIRSGSAFWKSGGVLHDIVSVFKHEMFAKKRMEDDIGVISVEPGFAHHEIITVAGANYVLKDRSFINVTGWGETDPEKARSGNSAPTERLYSVTVYVLNKDNCTNMINSYIGATESWELLVLDDSQFCAGTLEGGKDACVYDSGGPAVQKNVLVGIVSYGGPVCASKTYPGIYTNLRNLHGWLTKLSNKLKTHIVFTY